MSPVSTFLLVLVGALVAVIAGVILKMRAEELRRRGFASLADSLGLDFSAHDPSGLLFLPFALFQKGDGQGVENVIHGEWRGMPLAAFDFWFFEETTDSDGGTHRSYQRFSCAVTEVEADLPSLTIGRDNLFTRIYDAVRSDEINFETDEFNRAFNVESVNRKFAHDLIDQRMMAWLLAADRRFLFEVSGRWLLCFGPRLQPQALVPLLGTLEGFRGRVPRVVYDLYRPTASEGVAGPGQDG